jgi:SHS2 domain-containing protein
MSQLGMQPFHEAREHTSEIQLHLRAGSWGDLLAEAGRALAEVELAAVDSKLSGPARLIRVSSPDREALLVDWLNELIYLADSDRWIGLEFEIGSASNTEVSSRVSGVTAEVVSGRVKAATFHGLQVRDVPGGVEAEVILDV